MKLKEVWTGTPAEKSAKSFLQRIKRKPNLTPSELVRKRKTEGITRRQACRKGILIFLGTGLVVAAPTVVLPRIIERSDGSIVEEEIAKMHFPPADRSAEQQLLNQYGNGWEFNKITSFQEATKEAQRRIDQALVFMGKSKNEDFKAAYDYFMEKAPINEIGLSMSNQLNNSKRVGMGTTPVINEGKIMHMIAATPDQVNSSNIVIVSAILAHEISHAKNSRQAMDSLGDSLTLEEKLARERQRSLNPQEKIAEESQAYALQTRSILTEYGLGFEGFVTVAIKKDMAMFIKSGWQANSDVWQNHIATNYLDDKSIW